MLTDKVLRGYIQRVIPELEKQLSTQLGHPLEIGTYKGLRPWGFALGKTELLEGSKDQSRATIQGLKVQFAPIASAFNLKPVIIFTPKDLNLHLEDLYLYIFKRFY